MKDRLTRRFSNCAASCNKICQAQFLFGNARKRNEINS